MTLEGILAIAQLESMRPNLDLPNIEARSGVFSRDSDLTSTNVSLSVRPSVTDQYIKLV